MRIPSKLKIGGHTYTLAFQSLEDDDGKTDTSTNTITIDKDLPPSQRGAALFHEILHACNSTFVDKPLAHLLLGSLAEQLYQVFSDNKMLK